MMSDRKIIEENLRVHLGQLAHPRHIQANPEGHDKASHYIKAVFSSLGLSVWPQEFFWNNQTCRNWVATDPSESSSAPLLIIGAHYDSVPDCPGADDNASGMAVLLEAARLYRERQKRSTCPVSCRVQFVAFDLEECDLEGSTFYVETVKREGAMVLGMVCLEMLGRRRFESGTQRYPRGLAWLYPNRGDFIAIIGSTHSLGFFWKIRKTFRQIKGLLSQSLLVPSRGMLVPDVRRSDHAPFWDRGYPAVLITDTSFLRNPDYHGPHDLISTLDVPFMAAIVDAVDQTISRFQSTGV